MSEIKRSIKWWWAWNPVDLEDWLEEKEALGWRLTRVSFGAIAFKFIKGNPRKVRYCLDYRDKVQKEYNAIFEDAGWELIYSGMGWYIWRIEYQDQRPEIYTDLDSLLQRNKRQTRALTVIFAAQLPILMLNMNNFNHSSPIIKPFLIFYICIILLLVYAMFKLNKHSKDSEQKKK